jgi:hypothetical protein
MSSHEGRCFYVGEFRVADGTKLDMSTLFHNMNDAESYPAAAAPPSPAALIVALALIAALAALAGGLFTTGGLADHDQPEALEGLATIMVGCFLAAIAYGLRKLQLIEWHLQHR